MIGTEAEISSLVDYVISPSHERNQMRFFSYARVSTAVGALVGRGGGEHSVGLNFLLDCSEPAFWAAKTDVIKAAGFDLTQAALNLSISCTEALGLTRSDAGKTR
ncbi:MAG: hypothetical protein KAG66_08455, partial [Methylococcales bacterium]|nr:hypothetical protein [Methylococcales bacterium]